MNYLVVGTAGLALMLLTAPTVAGAADQCPAQLAQAKAALKSAQASLDKPSRVYAGAKSQDVQAPRAQDIQAPRGQDIQAPRSQDIQAPRSQDVQAPRGQDIQAPRAQDVQAPRSQQDAPVPRGQQTQAPRVTQAAKLAYKLGLGVNAGHGLNYKNVRRLIRIPEIVEYNIGHSIVARAVLVGFEQAVREMKDLLQ